MLHHDPRAPLKAPAGAPVSELMAAACSRSLRQGASRTTTTMHGRITASLQPPAPCGACAGSWTLRSRPGEGLLWCTAALVSYACGPLFIKLVEDFSARLAALYLGCSGTLELVLSQVALLGLLELSLHLKPAVFVQVCFTCM